MGDYIHRRVRGGNENLTKLWLPLTRASATLQQVTLDVAEPSPYQATVAPGLLFFYGFSTSKESDKVDRDES